MSDHTPIQWTDATWNPTTGCTKVSPGCAHCYIERTPAFRIRGRRFVNGATDLQLHANRLDQPLHWRRPRRVFVNSLSDLFHEDVPDAFIDEVFGVMFEAKRHTFQVLTKRAERMRAYIATRTARHCLPLPNVWLIVSAENQRFADERIPLLLQTPAAVRGVSLEPLLGPVDITPFMPNPLWNDLTSWKEPELDWVIVGGESGPAARPFDLAWPRSIVQQCKAAGVPCFVKQLGADPRTEDPTTWPNGRVTPYPHLYPHLHDRKGGDPSEWPEDLRVREFPHLVAA